MEAIQGFSKEIQHLNGSIIPISKFGVSQYEEEIRIQNQGFEVDGVKGQLILKVMFSFP